MKGKDHRTVCKPRDPEDPSFVIPAEFILKELEKIRSLDDCTAEKIVAKARWVDRLRALSQKQNWRVCSNKQKKPRSSRLRPVGSFPASPPLPPPPCPGRCCRNRRSRSRLRSPLRSRCPRRRTRRNSAWRPDTSSPGECALRFSRQRQHSHLYSSR